MLLITLLLSLMFGTFLSHLSQDVCTASLFPPWWLHFVLHSFRHCAPSHLVHVEITYRSIMFHSSVMLLEAGLSRWMHQCREVNRTSFHVMIQIKMNINQWGKAIYVSCHWKQDRIPSRGENKYWELSLSSRSLPAISALPFFSFNHFTQPIFHLMSVTPGTHTHSNSHSNTHLAATQMILHHFITSYWRQHHTSWCQI